ncbi:MAG: Rieske 2Fe-2S domain-containing protein [Bacteroidetes bacterium]|nr:Rieske 2Fe-2S domain-containing protein [Bacteroidota bacterium]
MSFKKYSWHKAASHINEIKFGPNNIGVVVVNHKTICIGKYNEQLFGFAHRCPHAGGPMEEGFIDALGNIVCPLHRFKFSMKNGRNVSGEGYYLKTWPVELRADGIYVGFEESGGLFGWFKS